MNKNLATQISKTMPEIGDIRMILRFLFEKYGIKACNLAYYEC